jgi:hypothetical protein
MNLAVDMLWATFGLASRHIRPISFQLFPLSAKMTMDMVGALDYPAVPRIEHKDTYSSKKDGTVVITDHYHWLEGKNSEVDSFVQSELDHYPCVTCWFKRTCVPRTGCIDVEIHQCHPFAKAT